MIKRMFMFAAGRPLFLVAALLSFSFALRSQTYCYTENFVGTELRAEPTDSLEDNVVSEIPLKSPIKVLFKSDNGYYFAVFDSKFGYINAATVTFRESTCRASLGFQPASPLNLPGRDVNAEIKRLVEAEINKWQQKSEFEKLADYQNRVNAGTREDKITEVSQTVLNALKSNERFRISNETFELSSYDAEHESFFIKTVYYGDFAIHVPIADAPAVKANWNNMSFNNIDFQIRDGRFFISRIDFYLNDDKSNVFSFDNQKTVTYENVRIKFTFDPINITQANHPVSSVSGDNDKQVNVGRSDIDTDIPKCTEVHDDYFAVIIGNENYAKELKVHYAINDARSVKEYFINTLGIPERNIRYLEDATYGQMYAEIDWLSGITRAYEGKVKLFFYYAGHGVPNPESKNAYLLPVDGYASNTGTAIKTEFVYTELSKNKPQQVTVFLDACFSGAAREGMLAGGRGVSVKPRQDVLKGNIVVFSAASGDETAYPYVDKTHGLFTYFLLKKIRDSKGEVTVGALADYVRLNVNQLSMNLHSRNQTPTLSCGTELTERVKELTLK